MTPEIELGVNRTQPFAMALAALTAFGLLLAACTSAAPAAPQSAVEGAGFGQSVPVDGGGAYVDLSPDELKTLLGKDELFVVNVHVPYEGEIPDTDAFIPFNEIETRLAEFPAERDAEIVVYCRSGSMSAIAARALVQNGYTRIYNLDGGFRSWAAQGYEFQGAE